MESFMLKRLFIAALITFTTTLSAQIRFTEAETTSNSNNTLQQANYITNDYTAITGYINYRGDIDYYKIEVLPGQTVTVSFGAITRTKMQPAGTVLNQQDLTDCVAANLTTYYLRKFVDGQPQGILVTKENRDGFNDCIAAALTTNVSFKTYDLALVSIYDANGNIIIPQDNYEKHTFTNEGNVAVYYYICLLNPIDAVIMGGSYFINITRS